jgi:integrase
MPAHLKPHPKTGYYYVVDGFYSKSLKTKSKSEANAKLKQYNRGKFGLTPVPTVGKFYAEWIEGQTPPLVRPSLERGYRQTFKAHILPRFRHVSLAELKAKDLIEFQSRLIRGRSIKTAKNILTCFRALYRDARQQYPAELQDKELFRLKWPKVQKEKPDPFTLDERDRILSWWRENDFFYFPWLYTLFHTGMRPSEAAALQWSDLDLERGTISITKSRDMNEDSPPKTEKSNRIIQVNQDLTRLIALLPSRKLGIKYVFVNKFGQPMNAKKWSGHNWAEPLEKLEIRHRKFYACRHTFITEQVRRDETRLKAIADYCGTSVAMIEDNYCAKLALLPDRDEAHREVFEKLPKKLNEIMVAGPGFEPGTSRL